MSQEINEERQIFAEAIDLPAENRAAFLAGACGTDGELLKRVQELLGAYSDESPVLKTVRDTLPAVQKISEGPGTKIGRYKLLQKIGEGGMGVVYMAEQTEPVIRKVALKIIKLGMDTRQVVARFEAERQALAMMDHPNIAKVLDAGATETPVAGSSGRESAHSSPSESQSRLTLAATIQVGRPYFVMELVRGVKITEYCDENHLSLTERLDLFLKVCQAVQHAHQKGIIHRDLKPSNILVTVNDGVPVPKVIDFGIAKATTGQRLTDKTLFTAFEQFIGTPAYMSPEQAVMTSLDIDTRTDIYSLGVLLYELLTGQTPFDARELLQAGFDEMRRTIREKEPLRPSTRLTQELASFGVPPSGGRPLISDLSVRRADAPPPEGGTPNRGKRSPHAIKELIPLLRGDVDWIVMKCLEKDRTRRYETANGLAADLKRHLDNEPVAARPPSAVYRLQKAWRRNKLVFSAGAAVAAALLIGLVMALWQAGVAKRAARELEANLYLTRLAAAHHELTAEPPNIQQAESLLEACKPEMRGWEWRYLKRLRLVDSAVLHDPGRDGVNSVSFSPDGRSIASAGADGNVRIWKIGVSPLPQAPVQTLAAHPGFAFCVAFHPTDPARLVSAGSDKRVKLWDLNTATEITSWPCSFSFEWGLAYAVAFSPDGQRLAFSSEEGSVSIFSSTTFQRIQTLTSASPRPVFSLAFSPDGRQLATGHGGGFVGVWEIESGRCVKALGRTGPPIGCVAFSRDGQRLAAASFDRSVQVWSMANLNGGPVRFQAHTDLVVGLAFSADSRRLATAGHDRTVKIWDPRTGQQVITFRSFTKQTCVAFSRDGNRLAASSMDGTIQLWDATPLAGGDDHSRHTLPHPLPISAMDISQDGSRLACGLGLSEVAEEKDRVFIWETATGRRVQTLPGQSVFVFSLAFSPDGRFLASVGDDQNAKPGVQTVKVVDLNTGRAAFAPDPFPGLGVFFCVAYSPDGRRLVAAGQDKQLKVWDAATGRKIGVMGEHDRNVFNLVFSPDGRYLASAGKDGAVRIWDGTRLDEHQSHFREMGPAGGDIADTMAFSADGTRLAVGSSDLTTTIWDVPSGTRVLTLPRTPAHGFRALAFGPDGHWLASGGTDSAVKVWDARTGTLLHTFRGHRGNVSRLKFVQLPEGLHLASGSLDRTVKLWPLMFLERSRKL